MTETVNRVRRAAVTGRITIQADKGFWSRETVIGYTEDGEAQVAETTIFAKINDKPRVTRFNQRLYLGHVPSEASSRSQSARGPSSGSTVPSVRDVVPVGLFWRRPFLRRF